LALGQLGQSGIGLGQRRAGGEIVLLEEWLGEVQRAAVLGFRLR
jgi:hypothetical protein